MINRTDPRCLPTVIVYGLGRSGRSTARALIKSGCDVHLGDDNLDHLNMTLKQFPDAKPLTDQAWMRAKTLIVSPGIPVHGPHQHWTVLEAKSHHIEIIGDMELFFRSLHLQARPTICGVTGTNGKTTTSALLYHIVKPYYPNAQLGGNIGIPVLNLNTKKKGTCCILELSSYQIETTPSLTLDCTILLNITEDHLDHHGSLSAYINAKTRALEVSKHPPILGVDSPLSYKVAQGFSRPCCVISSSILTLASLPDWHHKVFIHYNRYTGQCTLDDLSEREIHTFKMPLQGLHNLGNVAAALSAARQLGHAYHTLLPQIQTFQAPAYRLQKVYQDDSLVIVNDSKATNLDSALQALSCYSNIYWILGGVPKDGMRTLPISSFSHIRKAYIIGTHPEQFIPIVSDRAPYALFETLAEALHAVQVDIKHDPSEHATILFSPAASSFDQYSNYEERGAAFDALVHQLFYLQRKL